MGGAPSRETLLRSIMVEPTTAPHGGSKTKLVLIPLIPDYFPSDDCPIFQKFLELRRNPSVLYYYRDASLTTVSERMVPTGAGTDMELYNYYMRLGGERLVETDEALVAIHNAGRVFSPVPCVVAFTCTSPQERQMRLPHSNLSATTVGSATSERNTNSANKAKSDDEPNMLWAANPTTPMSSALKANTRNTTSLNEAENDHFEMETNSVYMPHFNIHVRITGFIGDTQICTPSMTLSDSTNSPMEIGLFLSKSLGGNYRINVTLLAAYTYISQLKQIGILSNSSLSIADQLACDSKLRVDSACKEFPAVTRRSCQKNIMSTQQQHLHQDLYDNYSNETTCRDAYDTELYCNRRNVAGAAVSDLTSPLSIYLIFARPLRLCFHRADVPSMCFLRELRMHIATSQRRQYDSKPMSEGKYLKSMEISDSSGAVNNTFGAKMSLSSPIKSICYPEVIQSTIEDTLLVVMVDSKDVWRIFLWAATYSGKSLDFLTSKNTFKMRKQLSKLNLITNTVDYLYTSIQMPDIKPQQLQELGSELKELVWIPPHATYCMTGSGHSRPVQAGTVLRFSKSLWEVSNNEFAEDLLLTICRRTNMGLRDAKPEDPRWVLNRNGLFSGLPEGLARGFLIWREEYAGQVVYHGTKPIFLKKWLESGLDPVVQYIAYISTLTPRRYENTLKPFFASCEIISGDNSFHKDVTDKSSQQGFSCNSLLSASRFSPTRTSNYINEVHHQYPMDRVPYAHASLDPKRPLLRDEEYKHRLSTDMSVGSGIANEEQTHCQAESSLLYQYNTNNHSTVSYDTTCLRNGFSSQPQQCGSMTCIYGALHGAAAQGNDLAIPTATRDVKSVSPAHSPTLIEPIVYRDCPRIRYCKSTLGRQSPFNTINYEEAKSDMNISCVLREKNDISTNASKSKHLRRHDYSNEQPCSSDATPLWTNSSTIKDTTDNLSVGGSSVGHDEFTYAYPPVDGPSMPLPIHAKNRSRSKERIAVKATIAGHVNHNRASKTLPIYPIRVRTHDISAYTHCVGFPPMQSCLMKAEHYLGSNLNDSFSTNVAKRSPCHVPLTGSLKQQNGNSSNASTINKSDTQQSWLYTSTNDIRIVFACNDIEKKGSRQTLSMFTPTTCLTEGESKGIQKLEIEYSFHSIGSNTIASKDIESSGQTALSSESKESYLSKSVNHFSGSHSGLGFSAFEFKNDISSLIELDMSNSQLLPNSSWSRDNHPHYLDKTPPSYSMNSSEKDNCSNLKVVSNESVKGQKKSSIKSLTRLGKYRWDWRRGILVKPLQSQSDI